MERISVIGSGRVGRAWAIVFARAGHRVTLFDAAPGAADASFAPILQGLQDLRKAGDVVDVLFGVERDQLPAEDVEGVDQVDRHLPEPGVERREKPDRPGADDRDVRRAGVGRVGGGFHGWIVAGRDAGAGVGRGWDTRGC